MDNTGRLLFPPKCHCNSNSVQLVAGSSIPRGYLFGPVPEMTFSTIRDSETTVAGRLIKVFPVNSQADNPAVKLWAPHLLPARDVFEQNLHLFRSQDTFLYIRACKDIRENDRLFGWYDESLALEKNVPHLTPGNILGSQQYLCSDCNRTFTYPNMLKIHMMHHCPPQTKSRPPFPVYFNNADQRNDTGAMCLPCFTPLHFCEFKACEPRNDQHRLSRDSFGDSEVYRPEFHHKYQTCPPSVPKYSVKASFEIIPPFTVQCREVTAISTEYKDLKSEQVTCSATENKDDVEMEEPMDVLSKSFVEFSTKDGYVCIYCGKLYSRKYGLKIHLRTHTGYKPLKCKVCLRAFGDPSNLNKHVRLHDQESAPYQCLHCGKVLVRRRDLARHMKSRHPRKHNT